MVWQLHQLCHGCFWCGISNVRNSRSLNLMTAQKNKQHIKKILLSKTQLEYLSKLAYIVLSHQYTDLGCARQNMSQRCPELTKFLPCTHSLQRTTFIQRQARLAVCSNGGSISCFPPARGRHHCQWQKQSPHRAQFSLQNQQKVSPLSVEGKLRPLLASACLKAQIDQVC